MTTATQEKMPGRLTCENTGHYNYPHWSYHRLNFSRLRKVGKVSRVKPPWRE